jgi:hypothetical protein
MKRIIFFLLVAVFFSCKTDTTEYDLYHCSTPQEILDMAALKALKEAAPFYPFPATIQREKLTIQANFIYTPNLETIAP